MALVPTHPHASRLWTPRPTTWLKPEGVASKLWSPPTIWSTCRWAVCKEPLEYTMTLETSRTTPSWMTRYNFKVISPTELIPIKDPGWQQLRTSSNSSALQVMNDTRRIYSSRVRKVRRPGLQRVNWNWRSNFWSKGSLILTKRSFNKPPRSRRLKGRTSNCKNKKPSWRRIWPKK